MARYKTAIAACARWEEHDIVEWIEYHKAIGVGHIYVYSNDDDAAILRKLLFAYTSGHAPYVTYLHWPYHVKQQAQMYLHFLENFKDEVEWLSFLDIDEFIVLKADQNISDFLAGFELECDCIYFNWLIYGNNGRLTRDATLPILPYYTARSEAVNLHTKNLVRTSKLDVRAVREKFEKGAIGFWHFWDGYDLDMRICDVLKNTIANYSADFPDSALRYVRQPGYSQGCLETAYVAHFQIKSEEDFMRRFERGGTPTSVYWKTIFDDGSYRSRLNQSNAVRDVTLAAFWHERIFSNPSIVSALPDSLKVARNIALFKPSWQSSVLTDDSKPLPAGAHVRDHANDGVRTGTFGIHTAHEKQPWWMVDLLALYGLSEVRIYNRVDRTDHIERLRGVIVEVSADAQDWTPVYEVGEHDYVGDVGNVKGPVVVELTNVPAQFVRLRLQREGILHVDEVEVFGRLPCSLPSVPAARDVTDNPYSATLKNESFDEELDRAWRETMGFTDDLGI